MKIYSVKDNKSGAFLFPQPFSNEAVALRCYGTAVNSSAETILGLYPEDCSIYTVGDWDEKTGEIKSDVVFVANALDLKIRKGGDR